MKRVLITGGTGFLGSHLTRRLEMNRDVDSITIVTTDIRQKNSLKTLEVNLDKINIVKGDIRDFDFLKLLFNEYEFDTVFHLGAISEVRKCQSDAKLAFDVNIGGTVNVLEVCRLYGNVKSIVVSSSDKAYGDGELPYRETHPLQGKATYEVSKSCTDLIAQSYHYNYDLPVVVTRCSNLYGGGDMNFSRVIPNTIRRLLDGKSPIIWKGSEKSTREFLYIEDAVDAYLSLVRNIHLTKGHGYNIGSGEVITIEELVSMMIDIIDPSIEIDYRDKGFPEISHQYLSSDLINETTGWTPSTYMKDGLERTIEKYKEIL